MIEPNSPISFKGLLSFLIHFLIRITCILIRMICSTSLHSSSSWRLIKNRVMGLKYYHNSVNRIKADVKGFTKLPEHLSIILPSEKAQADRLEVKLNQVAQLAAWSSCVGIRRLSIYENDGTFTKISPIFLCMILSDTFFYTITRITQATSPVTTFDFFRKD